MIHRHLLFVLFGCLALFAQVAQLILLRELATVFVGTELSLGVAFAAWCLGVAIGSFIGLRLLSRRTAQSSLPDWLVCLVTALPLLALATVRLLPGVCSVLPGTDLPFSTLLWLPLFVIGPFACSVGLAFVWGVSFLNDAGRLYMTEAAGTLAGGILFHFAGVESSPLALVALLAFLCVVSWCAVTWQITTRPRLCLLWLGKHKMVFSCGAILLGLWWWAGPCEQWLRRQQWQALAPEQTLLADRLSRHGYLAVLDAAEQKNFYSNGRYFMSSSPGEELSVAQVSHLLLVQHPEAKSLLLVGGGLNGFVRKALLYPLEEIHYCELDPALVELAYPYLSPVEQKALGDTRVHIHYQDARCLVEKSHHAYDLIIQFLPEPTTAAMNRYYTREYFAMVKKSLRPGGVFIFTLQSLPFPEGELLRRNGMIWRTLSEAFREVHAIPGTTAFFLASDDTNHIALDSEECAHRFAQMVAHDTCFHPALYRTLLDQEAIAHNAQMLREAAENIYLGETPGTYATTIVNSDAHPRAILSSLNVNGISPFIGSQFSEWTETIARVVCVTMWGAVALILGMAFWHMLRCRQVHTPTSHKLSLLLTIAFIGFAGMASEIVLLWAFLSSYGYLYAMLGLFTALFMLGVTAGAWLGRKVAGMRYALTMVQAVFAVYLFMLPGLLGYARGEAGGLLLLLFNLLPGVLVGMAFPLASYAMQKFFTLTTGTGGLYAADMLGASVGALLIGSFALPLWGVHQVCYAMSLCATAVLLLLCAAELKPARRLPFASGPLW
jgi:spermidine synthase